MISKEEKLARNREWWNKNKEILNRKQRERYSKNKEKYNEMNKRYYKKNKKKIDAHNKERYFSPECHKRYCLQHREYNKKYWETKKLIVISHYSHGKNCCELCGISDVDVLSIDHINGGGTIHRKEVGSNMSSWLIRNNFPEGYRILCMNCQYKERKKKNQFRAPNKKYFL